MAGAAPKLKLLCLHGYMQNAEVFRSRLGSMRKALKSRVEFVFLEAPFEAQGLPAGSEPEVSGARDGRSWWQWTDTGPDGRPSRAASYTGWEVTQSYLLAALQEHQPDGLLGFSQGATAAALFVSHLAATTEQAAVKTGEPDGGSKSDSHRLKCSILVAGFLPRDPSVAALVQEGGRSNTMPLLFITGTSDLLVPPERTAQLWDCFHPATVSSYTHSGAHLVPTCSGEFKGALARFLDTVSSSSSGPGPAVPSLHTVQQPVDISQQEQQRGGSRQAGAALSASQSAVSLASSDNGSMSALEGAAAEADAKSMLA